MPEKNEKQLESMESVRWVEREKNYGGEELWNYGNDKNYYSWRKQPTGIYWRKLKVCIENGNSRFSFFREYL